MAKHNQVKLVQIHDIKKISLDVILKSDCSPPIEISHVRVLHAKAKMTVASDKLVYDISPAKTDSFKPIDQFCVFIKMMYPLCIQFHQR